MKQALLFIIVGILIFSMAYYVYVSVGGVPIEDLFNSALGLEGEGEEEGGIIVVELLPYMTVIALLLGAGALLYYKNKRNK